MTHERLIRLSRGRRGQPFFTYILHNNIRIFFIVDIHRSYHLLEDVSSFLRPSDYFFVEHWMHSDYARARLDYSIVTNLKLNHDNFFIQCNDARELQCNLGAGFNNCLLFNHNAWIDENVFTILSKEKIYDALLIARPSKLKRVHLAAKINNLAYLSGLPLKNTKDFFIRNNILLPSFTNKYPMVGRKIVHQIINQSYCGLCLSQREGACRSSTEYLLCGIPVVSTPSFGGRDFWYTEKNSIICNDNEDSVREAVIYAKEKRFNSELIRESHIKLSKQLRNNFILITKDLFKKHDVNIDANDYFNKVFINGMKTHTSYNRILSAFNN